MNLIENAYNRVSTWLLLASGYICFKATAIYRASARSALSIAGLIFLLSAAISGMAWEHALLLIE